MIVVALWTLFGVLLLAGLGLMIAAVCGFSDAGSNYSTNTRAARLRWWSVLGLVVTVALVPFTAWAATYVYAEGSCTAVGGEFVTHSGGAGWRCLLDEDFGPLPVDQNFRFDITD